MMFRAAVLCVLLAVWPPPVVEASRAAGSIDLLPSAEEFPDWDAGARRAYSTAKALYDYMDGGAELYLDYGFQDLAVGEWESPEGDPLKIEIYRMGRPKSAYGLFTQDTWGEEIDVGQGARVQGGTLRFWKGQYFARVFMWRGYEEHRPVLLKMAEFVAGRIETTGEVPTLVSLLPTERLVEGGLHFFHTSLALGGLYYLSDENPLGLSQETDGVIGEYLLDEEDVVYLVIVSYADTQSARQAFEHFLGEESSQAEVVSQGEDKAVLTYDDGLCRTIERRRSFVGLALDCPAPGACQKMLEEMMGGLDAVFRESAETGRDSESDCAE